MAIYLIRGDLVNMNVDAIVSNANVNLRMVEGVGRAIFHKAGDIDLTNELKKIGHCDVGKAVTTKPFGITNTKLIIHAVGPNYINGKHKEEKNLRSAYKEIFKILEDNNFTSVAMPILSSDFNYPLEECYYIQIDECKKYLETHLNTDIYIVFYKNNLSIYDDEEKEDLSKFLNSNYKNLTFKEVTVKNTNTSFMKELNKFLNNNKDIDKNTLLLNANLKYDYLDKLTLDENIIPSKGEIISLGISLKLSIKEINILIRKVGYELSYNNLVDLIVIYYLTKNIYDVFKINDCLFYHKLETL